MIVDAPDWLGEYLNSNLIKWYFPLIATGLGEKGTRYFKQFVENIPVPHKFDGNLERTFGFTEDEMKLISSSDKL